MRNQDDIAQAVLYAEKIKHQRREAGVRQREKLKRLGLKKIQIYVPIIHASEVTKMINTYVKNLQE